MIRVLVADDMKLIRRLLAQQLSREADISIAGEAQDGRQAVELCLSLSPDVVLMDLSMPKMNGVEAMERIRALRPDTRIILLSAHEELVSLGRLSGAAESLDKNCTPQELTATIRRVASVHTENGMEGAEDGGAKAAGTVPNGSSKTMPGVEPDTMPAGALAGGADGRLSEAPGRATNLCATVERLALRTGLSEREKTILTQLVSTDFTVGQIATVLSAETGTSVTEVAVKHTIERVMNKLAIEPRTRATLIRFVLERCHAETARGTRGWVE